MGTDYWTKEMAKEMKNVWVAFEMIPHLLVEQMQSGKVKLGNQVL